MFAQRLLSALSEVPRSLPELAAELGVAEPALKDALLALGEQGVPLRRGAAGWHLPPGTPTEAALRPRGHFGQAYRYLGTVGSSQDELRAWEGAPHGAVVLAERQTAGRGRRGRPWVNPGASLMFSVLLTEQLNIETLALVPLAAGVALREVCGVGGLKWPNDLLAPDGRKLAGILLEADVRGRAVRRAVLGLGLNVSGAPDGAASLSEFRPVRRVDVLRDLLAALETWLARPAEEVLSAWRAVNLTLGREMSVTTGRGEVRGTAVGLTPDGALLVETGGGAVRISGGEVQLVAGLETPPTSA